MMFYDLIMSISRQSGRRQSRLGPKPTYTQLYARAFGAKYIYKGSASYGASFCRVNYVGNLKQNRLN